jgi:hypothetical protein
MSNLNCKIHIENHTQPHLGFLKYANTCLRLYENDRGATLVLQAHGLLPLLLAAWFSPLVCLLSHVLFSAHVFYYWFFVQHPRLATCHIQLLGHGCMLATHNSMLLQQMIFTDAHSSLSDLQPPTFVQNCS